MVEVLFALARDCFQPMKVMTPVHEEGVHHLPNPLEVTLRLTAPTPEVVYSALSAEALMGEGIAPREDGMLCSHREILVYRSTNTSIRTPTLTSITSMP